ncbi:TonB family protein [Hymenobacter sp. HMF4947]|uniref:TonB family protein n=1 Tax=Hymenobacter ginkgonis TaxID=2682976 RepID=A0A7K1THS4_9BACT|nr:energy transducer TonB [Hymenobacter ginkgonis]MVN77959.1 TonB family protein [Hymenobacter ginkgonis]
MITRFIGGLLVATLGLVSSAAAQRAAGPSLAAVLPSSVGGGSSPAAAPLFKPDSIFINPDVRPQFTGGDAGMRAYMTKNLHYPEQALRKHLTGKVYVRFVLSATGQVTDASVVRGPGSGLNEEALRLVWLMPPWQPARQRGQTVRVVCTIPIEFQE